MIKIYSSLSQKKEVFKPIHEGKVGLYVCGITVYDLCHIGHARSMVAFDTIVRFLRAQGYEVNYVRNITDIDDKIIKRAAERNEPIDELTERYIREMHQDFADLKILPPDQEPRATAHIDDIIALIKTLEEKGVAYLAENGDVYYAVEAFKEYGKLSHRELEESNQAGARVAIQDAKRNPLDFVLWKAAKPGEPAWESPWGHGRPGWHIECSAMSMHCLGEHFDLHGGGFDLLFPHHENEVAQSEAATGKTFVNTWIHVGFVQVNKEKMSKSLGNFFTIREVLEEYSHEVVRYFLGASHYRSPINYSQESLSIAQSALERFYLTLRGLDPKAKEHDEGFEDRFIASMNDDFNTPEAMAVLFDLAREINRVREQDVQKAQGYAVLLRRLGNILGILQHEPDVFLREHAKTSAPTISTDEIERLIAARNTARAEKNWKKADEVRDQLAAAGITIEDGSQGTTWRVTA